MAGEPPEPSAGSAAPSDGLEGGALRRRLILLAVFSAALAALFARPLWALARFSLANDLYSYIPLIPLVSLYLVWTERRRMAAGFRPARGAALAAALAGAALLGAGWWGGRAGWTPEPNDHLALMTASVLLLFLAGCLLILGGGLVRAAAFQVSFLVFTIPLPTAVHHGIERFLQVASAYSAHLFFWLSFTPAYQEGTFFQLPGFRLEVAPECSGIHSTYMLFITSLLAAHLFLRSPWRRAILVLFVIPLALLRNGVRIFTIGELCVHISPQMIDSYIHRHGGPYFFALSLVPFFLLLFKLQKSEHSTSPSP